MVGPADLEHAARCSAAWHFHRADPDRSTADPATVQRRIGALMSRARAQTDPITHLWLPAFVVLATGAVVMAQLLLQDRSVGGYVIIVTALVLLQCSAALLTLQWIEAARERRFRDAMGPMPPELGGDLPVALGPVTDPEWGLHGRIGTVVHVGDRTVPVVAAEGNAGKDVDPWTAIRVGASLRLLEVRDGAAPQYGLATYEDGVFRVPYGDVRGPVRLMATTIADGGHPPQERDHDVRRRCTTCPWRVPCNQSLA